MLDPTQSANVLGFLHLIERFRVTYDSAKEDAFNVHTKWGIVKFQNCERLYIYEPSERYFDLIKCLKQANPAEKPGTNDINAAQSENTKQLAPQVPNQTNKTV